MGRKILAVILGYLAMAVVVMGGLTGAYFAMGADKAFEAGTYEVTTAWLVVWGATSIVAAVVGGWVCGKIGKTKGAVGSLILLVVLLGALYAFAVFKAEDPAPEDLARTGDTPNFEAMNQAQSPMWVHVANPVLGVIGIMIGGRLSGACKGNGKSESSSGEDSAA
jgi:hypothetical protein